MHAYAVCNRKGAKSHLIIGSNETIYLIIYCFTSRSRIFYLYGDVTITGEGLQNLGLCSALRAFEQGGIYIVPHLLWHGAPWFFRFDPKNRPIQSPFTTREGMWRIYSTPDLHRSPISRFLRYTRRCGGPILTRILTFFCQQYRGYIIDQGCVSNSWLCLSCS